MKIKSVIYSLGIGLICLCFTLRATGQKQAAPQVLPKPEQAFGDAKIGRT
jgi:hypothetical protein